MAQGILDRGMGCPVGASPSFLLPPAGSPLKPDPPGFGDNVVSVYLSNPDTSRLSNFTLDFWIRFDDDAGRVMITFRMQDDRNFYALLLSDTRDWYSGFWKYSDDKPALLADKGPGVFAPRKWSHVRMDINGQVFSFSMDGEHIVTARDEEWTSGRTLGIGFYNGYNYFTVHVDQLTLTTMEPLYFTKVITQSIIVSLTHTSVVIETSRTTISETSTQVTTIFSTTTTTSTSQLLYHILVTNTTFTTKLVTIFTPTFDANSCMLLFGVGIFLGCVGDLKRYRNLFTLLISALAIILAIYFQAPGAAGLSALAAMVAGGALGWVLGRLFMSPVKPRERKKGED
jgi:hypothetical protein